MEDIVNTTVANLICLLIGFTRAYGLMLDTDGVFAPHKAEGLRIALALLLCFFGGWFTRAEPNTPLHPIDWVGLTVLATLTVAALKWPPIT